LSYYLLINNDEGGSVMGIYDDARRTLINGLGERVSKAERMGRSAEDIDRTIDLATPVAVSGVRSSVPSMFQGAAAGAQGIFENAVAEFKGAVKEGRINPQGRYDPDGAIAPPPPTPSAAGARVTHQPAGHNAGDAPLSGPAPSGGGRGR
jgi:hypothetical protein